MTRKEMYHALVLVSMEVQLVLRRLYGGLPVFLMRTAYCSLETD
jgi:hypothetical protein